MDFTFTEDQLLFQASVHDFLTAEVTPERMRAGWEIERGRDPALWQQLADTGPDGPDGAGGVRRPRHE